MAELTIVSSLLILREKYQKRYDDYDKRIEMFPGRAEILRERKNIYGDVLQDMDEVLRVTGYDKYTNKRD